ncbi:hypothetical protein I4F81_001380 [Pyropia yezoensis]|uniref:Uncharacterized protein n=1 Tax=Pyropia yezoensis TaxID=2788 RepID=A0ACC3BLG2_PYRYE|nr:hypothetical protein I4F81_001380 [Neopyropia yezoensis]
MPRPPDPLLPLAAQVITPNGITSGELVVTAAGVTPPGAPLPVLLPRPSLRSGVVPPPPAAAAAVALTYHPAGRGGAVAAEPVSVELLLRPASTAARAAAAAAAALPRPPPPGGVGGGGGVAASSASPPPLLAVLPPADAAMTAAAAVAFDAVARPLLAAGLAPCGVEVWAPARVGDAADRLGALGVDGLAAYRAVLAVEGGGREGTLAEVLRGVVAAAGGVAGKGWDEGGLPPLGVLPDGKGGALATRLGLRDMADAALDVVYTLRMAEQAAAAAAAGVGSWGHTTDAAAASSSTEGGRPTGANPPPGAVADLLSATTADGTTLPGLMGLTPPAVSRAARIHRRLPATVSGVIDAAGQAALLAALPPTSSAGLAAAAAADAEADGCGGRRGLPSGRRVWGSWRVGPPPGEALGGGALEVALLPVHGVRAAAEWALGITPAPERRGGGTWRVVSVTVVAEGDVAWDGVALEGGGGGGGG